MPENGTGAAKCNPCKRKPAFPAAKTPESARFRRRVGVALPERQNPVKTANPPRNGLSAELSDLKAAAHGRWPEIHAALGIPARLLNTRKHQPCPYCGGKDRYRYTDYQGSGGYICNQCTPDGGSGFDLIMLVFGYSFTESVNQVSALLGMAGQRPPESRPAPRIAPPPNRKPNGTNCPNWPPCSTPPPLWPTAPPPCISKGAAFQTAFSCNAPICVAIPPCPIG